MQNKYLNIIGMMTGTSADGIDISLVRTNGHKLENLKINSFYEFEDSTRKNILNIMNEKLVTKLRYKKYFDDLISKEHHKALISLNIKNKIDFVGFHGQTIHHDPIKKISIQCGNPNLLSNLLRKDVIFNFRQNDLDNGGEGAPIAPVYHRYLLKKLNVPLPACFLNIGGISNLTYYDNCQLIGFDTGPGNCLIDDYMLLKTDLRFDKDGTFGFQGSPSKKIINYLLQHPFFKKQPPKSLDRNFLKLAFKRILNEKLSIFDMVSTLSNFTVQCIISSIESLPSQPKSIVVSGGGSNNKYLVHLLTQKLKLKVLTNNELNINSNFVEAELIAFLSARTVYNLPLTFQTTTGVNEDVSGGQIFYYKKPC